MDLKRETIQRDEFRAILRELATSQEKLQDAYFRVNMYKRLEALYDEPSTEKQFRHFYSDIFSELVQIKQNPILGDINILGENLSFIRKNYQPKNKAENGRIIDISDAIKKLYDHVSLDIARILYSDAGDWKISGEEAITHLQSDVMKISKHIENVQNDAEEKIKNQQKEHISILGIFAAVVLAFTGGIAFSTSVLENIAQASIYRTILVALIIGLVFVNILFGLFYYINKIVSKEEKFYPLFVSNAVILGLIIITMIAWSFGWVESRDKRIHVNELKITSQIN